MIEPGDGTMQRRLDAGRCPACNTASLVVTHLGASYDAFQCRICNLKIKNCKDDGNEANKDDG